MSTPPIEWSAAGQSEDRNRYGAIEMPISHCGASDVIRGVGGSRGSVALNDIRLGGRWIVEAFAPVAVRDPLALLDSFRRGVGRFQRWLSAFDIRILRETSMLPVSAILRARASDASPEILGELAGQVPGVFRPMWSDVWDNKIVNVGLDDLLGKYLLGSAYTAAHYVGLTANSPTVAAADTMASHAGWTEVTGYNEATRQAYTPAAISGQATNNNASPAVFTITSPGTAIGGCFLTTNNTKGGSTGILFAGGAFAEGNRTLSTADTMTAKYALSVSSAS